MKLLKDEVIERADGGVELSIKPVTTSQQAHIMSLASKAGIEARVELTNYALRNLVESVVIDGSAFNPSDLADRADLSDKDTVQKMILIGSLVSDIAFPSGESEKK